VRRPALLDANLLDRIADPRKRLEPSRAVRAAILQAGRRNVPCAAAADRPGWDALGLTDAVLLVLGADPSVLLTADPALHLSASRAGHGAVNLNHHRSLG